MSYDGMRFWLELGIFTFAAANWFYTYMSNRGKATKEELTKIDERAVKLRVEVTEIKSDLKHLPTEQALSALTVQLSNLHGDMKALSERMNGVASIQEMMKDHARIMDEFLRKMP